MLIARIHDKGTLPPPSTQNLQMMRFEPCEEDPNINIVLRSGIVMGYDKGKQPEDNTWVHKAPAKEADFDLEHAREAFIEAKKSFVEASTSGSKDKSVMSPNFGNILGSFSLTTLAQPFIFHDLCIIFSIFMSFVRMRAVIILGG